MKERKIVSVVLAFVMMFSLILTTSVSAALVPPKNSTVQQEKKNATRDFATQGVWDSWVKEGSPVTNALPTGGPSGEGALSFSGTGATGMVLLDQFGDLSNFDVLTFAIKSTQPFTIKFALRDQTATPQDIGSSQTVTIPSTQGAWKNVSVKRSDFYGGVLTNEQIDGLKSVYDATTNKYKPVVFMYLGSQEATISNLYARWYESVLPVDKFLESNMQDGNKPGLWGFWNGTTAAYTAGKAEDGVGTALYITGGANGGGGSMAFTGGGMQNFIGFDAFCLRVKSTAGFSVKVTEEYRASGSPTKSSKNVTIPSTKGEWKDIYVNATDLKPDVDGDWIYNMKGGYTTNFEPVIQMRYEQTNFGTSNYAIIGDIKALWYSKLPSVQSISFTNNGTNIDDGLVSGTTNVNVVLQNTGLKDYTGAVLVAALYDTTTNKLVKVGTKYIDVPATETSGTNTISLAMPPNGDPFNYEIKVLLWANKDTLGQVTDVMTFNAYGASGQPQS